MVEWFHSLDFVFFPSIPIDRMFLFLAAFSAMVLTTLLRGFQNKNVAGGHKRLAFICGAIMTVFEGLVIALIAKGGTDVIYFTAIGSGIGWVLGMFIHDAIMYKRMKAERKLQKSKYKRKLEKQVESAVQKKLEELGLI
jgi:hypothetical protein